MTTTYLTLLLAAQVLAADPAPPKARPENPPRLSNEAFDEDAVAGHPDGEPPALPKHVNWSLEKAEILATPRRRRLTLAGPWRFAATTAREVSPQRDRMGWLQMPADALTDWQIRNPQGQSTPGKWQGKPLKDYSYAWIERVLDAPVQWVRHQVFLVLRGPWAEAELFVAYQPIPGIERDGGRWFEITEALVYGGEAPLALRLKNPGQELNAQLAEVTPFVGLELLPTGPRFDALRVCQDPGRRELELTIDLRRPKFILGLPVRLPEIPLIVQVSYENAEDRSVIYRFDQNIGPMPEEHHSVSLRLPWSAAEAAPPDKARLRARLTSVYGGNMDIAYPLEFAPARLEPVRPE